MKKEELRLTKIESCEQQTLKINDNVSFMRRDEGGGGGGGGSGQLGAKRTYSLVNPLTHKKD